MFQHLLDKFIVTNSTYSENRHIYVDIGHIWTSNRISWYYSKLGDFPTWNINFNKRFGVLQPLLVKVTVTNDTYSGKGHITM